MDAGWDGLGGAHHRPFVIDLIHLHLSHEVTRVSPAVITGVTEKWVSCALYAAPPRVQTSETHRLTPRPGGPKRQPPVETWHQTAPRGTLGRPCWPPREKAGKEKGHGRASLCPAVGGCACVCTQAVCTQEANYPLPIEPSGIFSVFTIPPYLRGPSGAFDPIPG